MAEFCIRTEELKTVHNRFLTVQTSINTTKAKLQSVQGGLGSIGLGEVSGVIDALQTKMQKAGLSCESISAALSDIISRFLAAEAEIVAAGAALGDETGGQPSPSENVFNDDGTGYYGGDQGAPYKLRDTDPDAYNELANIVKSYFPDMTDDEIYQYLRKLNSEGCGYVAMINSVFNYYDGKPEEFEEIFGYSMYDENGNPNYNRMLVDVYCMEDNHNKRSFLWWSWDKYDPTEDCNWTDADGDGWFEGGGYGNTQGQMEWRWEQYCEAYGVDANVRTDVNVTPSNYDSVSQNGMVSVLCSDFTMVDTNGNDVHVTGGHFMTITGVNENGDYIVSSWGDEYTLSPDAINGFEHYQVISYK
ncbi:MAG: hypothetical protein Q4D54_02935 [Eubacteriales bacterium]|nr:hypothetical protein [Eubacteriales bacterium]